MFQTQPGFELTNERTEDEREKQYREAEGQREFFHGSPPRLLLWKGD